MSSVHIPIPAGGTSYNSTDLSVSVTSTQVSKYHAILIPQRSRWSPRSRKKSPLCEKLCENNKLFHGCRKISRRRM